MRIVAMAPNAWHGQWVNRQQLLSRLGLKHSVVYSNGPWSVWDRASAAFQAAPLAGRFERCDNVTVEVAPRMMLRWQHALAYDGAVMRLHAWRLRRYFGADRSPLVALIFHPMFAEYGRLLRADAVAYHAYDLFESTPDWSPALDAAERGLLREATLVTAASQGIAERLRERVDREVRVLPNGVDLASFERARADGCAVPTDLERIPRPRLGYVGSLHPQVDFSLVARLARARPHWNFVFVGARGGSLSEPRAAGELALCESCPNVHWLGEKHREDVPRYVINMDVNLMVYRLADGMWVKAGYPLKLHEYLAAGRPVVSADLAAVREFASVVDIAVGDAGWIAAIEQALERGGRGSPRERRNVATQNTWDARAAHLDGWLAAVAREQPS